MSEIRISPSIVTPVALNLGGTGVDLSAAGGAHSFLAQDASHIVSARVIAIGDLFSADGATTTNFLTEAGTWAVPAGSGGGGAPTTDVYVLGTRDATNLPNAVVNPTVAFGPDVAPASPGSLDDEFNGTSLSVSWTGVNTPVTSVANSYLGLSAVAHSGTKFYSILKAAPATPWTVVAKMSLICMDFAYSVAGIILTNGTATSNEIIVFGPGSNSTGSAGAINEVLELTVYSTYTNFSTGLWSNFMSGKSYYLKVQDTGTNLVYSFSLDGVNWLQVYSAGRTVTLAGGPSYVGLCIDAESTSTPAILSCDWFRRTQ